MVPYFLQVKTIYAACTSEQAEPTRGRPPTYPRPTRLTLTMVFDKTKAMRNAERFVALGKLQSAIGEYKQVVAHDSKDFATMNMLGDLYAKNLETKQAVACYMAVAEHYGRQGFAQKAIAIYNKISKIQPNTIQISEKLA